MHSIYFYLNNYVYDKIFSMNIFNFINIYINININKYLYHKYKK